MSAAFLAVACARGVVNLNGAGLGEVVPSADVVGQARAHRENDVGGLEQFHAQRRDVAASAADRKLVIVKEAACRKSVGEHGAATVGELQHGFPGAGTEHAATAQDDRPLRRLQPFDGFGNDHRIWVYASDLGIVDRRGFVRLVEVCSTFCRS